jgi:arylsulfatase A-like enzyme
MPISRRGFLAAAAPAVLRGAQPPNIVLIMTDQQTHDGMSCAGNKWVNTPAMDSLAREGTRYSTAYCAYPVCSPSRSTVFSGALPHETQVMVNGRAIRAGLPTLGEVFSKAGYNTVYGGKWHLPKSFDGMTGFTKIAGGSALGMRMDTPLADKCVEWIGQKPKEPFLLVASFMNPHDVCQWIRDHAGACAHPSMDGFPAVPRNVDVDPNEPECIQYHRSEGYDLMSEAVGIASKWTTDEFRHYQHDYYRMVEQVDRELGRVLAALRASKRMENTLVAFCSDHGEGMGAHRWVQKASFYEESARVPLILAGPGVPSGRVNANLASLEDLMPTFCETAGIRVPESCTGQSLLKSHRKFVTSELRYGDPSREGRMLRTDRYKYVAFNSGRNPEQFFDLSRDPGETNNLANNTSARKELSAHRVMLKKHSIATGDKLFA